MPVENCQVCLHNRESGAEKNKKQKQKLRADGASF